MKNHLSNFIKFVLTGATLYYIASAVPISQVVNTALKAHPSGLFLALLLFITSKYFSAKRLQFLFEENKIYISEANNLRLYLLGMFYNLFLPGGVGGDGYKAYLLHKKSRYNLKMLGKILLADRLSGLAALGCYLWLFLFFLPSFPFRLHLLLGLPFAYLVFYAVQVNLMPWGKIYWEMETYSFLVQLSQMCSAVALLFSLNSFHSLFEYLFLFLLSSIVSVLPFTIGGLGARELTFVVSAPWLGVDPALAVSIGVLFYAITAFTSFFGILYTFHPEKLIQPYNENSQ
jgi:glycosyltransferase 2 family protein